MACNAEDCGFQMLYEDEIVTSAQEESGSVDDETDEDEDSNNNKESSKSLSNADAFSALETAMEWYEEQSKGCPTQLLLLKRVRDLAAKKRRCTMVLRKISDYFPPIKVKLRHFAPILLFLHVRFPYVMIFNLIRFSVIRTVSVPIDSDKLRSTVHKKLIQPNQ
ncbi:uncharacterized protein TNCV_1312271 [Trichonephila clavipes]|nr:uncharacterized protein TNCV_1312271 [Trichonephila clavipes]